MAIPSFDRWMHVVLQTLAKNPGGLRKGDACLEAARIQGLTEAEKRALLPGGKLVFRNRIGWAYHHLKSAGLTESPRMGLWKITKAGLDALKAHPTGFDDAYRRQLLKPGFQRQGGGDAESAAGSVAETSLRELVSPEEQIDVAIRELEDRVSGEVLELLHKGSPEFFEQVVLDVLQAMGYGAAGSVNHVGRAGDGGIDGVITLDRLGLQKVCVQAKRWQGSVGRPVVQEFFGALAHSRAHHGVLITTSGFTQDAVDFAQQVSDRIVLVDGERLADLMIEHGVGVAHKTQRLPQVDRDYFEEA